MSIVSVALPTPIDRTYSYRIPEHLKEHVTEGSAIVVPFGRRVMTGVVTERTVTAVAGSGSERQLKDAFDLVDEQPVFTAEQLELTRWISEYYLCSWGEALRAAMPPGMDSASQNRVRRTDLPAPADLPEIHRKILQEIPAESTISARALGKSVPGATLSRLRALQERGLVEIETRVRGPRTRVRTEQFVRPAEHPPGDAPRGVRQRAVLAALTDADRPIRQSELLKSTGATSATLRRLEELGHLAFELREIDRSDAEAGHAPDRHVILNEAQQSAVDAVGQAVSRRDAQTFLLHGITGSGKTEVYLRVLESVRTEGRSAIILVPEIALTPQTVRRFRARFGDEIAVLHSRMGAGERFDAWRGIRAGRYSIVIGPRSAVLAPVSDLGLVVVDEEHEPSYKQFDPAPRYHARDVAVMRARMNGAVCVLGSATPSLESYANAKRGKYRLLSLPERVDTASGQARLPSVRIVDVRSAARREAGALSEPLREAIRLRLEKNEQTILLQNRRGYSPILRCDACAWIPECPDCSVSMTYHKAKKHLRCHYCGRTARVPRSCPSCGTAPVSQIGVGTQRVQEELAEAFPDVRASRMDLDTTTTRNAHHEILDDFASGSSRILLGTQMVAKGLDFGRVTLVGVIDADTGLSLPDIRAEERAFHLLTQVAGRAGRADLPGEVILQTRNPGHRVIQRAIRHDYERFTGELLAEREALGYPPSGRLIAVLFSGPDEQRVWHLAEAWKEAVLARAPALNILGPSEAFIGRVRRQYRAQLMIKIRSGESHRAVRTALRAVLADGPSGGRAYRILVDVDPVGLA